MTFTPDPAGVQASRDEIGADSARTVLAAAARRLAEAHADYEDALDRQVSLSELQFFDRELARAGDEPIATAPPDGYR